MRVPNLNRLPRDPSAVAAGSPDIHCVSAFGQFQACFVQGITDLSASELPEI